MVVILTTEEACSRELKALVKTFYSPRQLRTQTLGPVVLKSHILWLIIRNEQTAQKLIRLVLTDMKYLLNMENGLKIFYPYGLNKVFSNKFQDSD